MSMLNWTEAPQKTQWGAGMMVADVALDKDSTVTLYAHRDDLHKVAAAIIDAAHCVLFGDEPTPPAEPDRSATPDELERIARDHLRRIGIEVHPDTRIVVTPRSDLGA